MLVQSFPIRVVWVLGLLGAVVSSVVVVVEVVVLVVVVLVVEVELVVVVGPEGRVRWRTKFPPALFRLSTNM